MATTSGLLLFHATWTASAYNPYASLGWRRLVYNRLRALPRPLESQAAIRAGIAAATSFS
jgi:hypothetical protein